MLDEKTIAFVDFVGNRQYMTLGNLSENPKAHLFLIDYVHRRRIKIWGTARAVEGDCDLLAKLMPKGTRRVRSRSSSSPSARGTRTARSTSPSVLRPRTSLLHWRSGTLGSASLKPRSRGCAFR